MRAGKGGQSNGLKGNIPAFDPIAQYESIEKTAEGVLQYRQEMDKLAETFENSGLEDLRCTITFAEPMILSDLQNLSQKYDMSLEVVEIRHIVDDVRYTSAVMCKNDWHTLEGNIMEINNDLGSSNFKEIIDVYATVDADKLSALREEKMVYLIDASGDAAAVGSRIVDGEKRNRERFDNGLNDYPKSLAWELEDMKDKVLN